jgi:hypothetical protein
MKRLKPILALILALVYPLAGGGCLLETLDLVTAVDCCAQPVASAPDHPPPCGGFGCCPIEYAAYFSFFLRTADTAAPPAEAATGPILLLPPDRPPHVQVAPPERSPPSASPSWRFFFRTALPPRAPSLLS